MRKMMMVLLLLVFALVLPQAGWGSTGRKGRGILLVAFGTSEPGARGALERIEDGIRKAFPDSVVRLSYTSGIIRRKILREEGLAVDSPLLALAKMQDEGFSSVTVQSLHVMPGEEYHQIEELVRSLGSIGGKYGFPGLSLGKPLLDSLGDYGKMTDLLREEYGSLGEGGGAVVFMGHGTDHWANASYSQMQFFFDEAGLPFVMGTVEGFPGIEQVKRRLAAIRPSGVTLVPFMVVAGDHARNDMSDESAPDSWISMLRKEGYSVRVLLKGLGECAGLPGLFAGHIREAAGEGP